MCASARGCSRTSIRAPALPVGASFRSILVPMKLGDIGEEMVATAVALAKEKRRDDRGDHRRAGAARAGARRAAATRRRREADASVAEARALGEENGVDVHAEAVHARSIGHAIVDEAHEPERRPDRAGLVAALAEAVAVLLADGRPRPAPRALRGARRRVPRGRVRRVTSTVMKAVVIGCGRDGASVAKQLAGDGWDVTCVDEDEMALTRLGDWRGGFVVGHGMDLDVLDNAGVAKADAAVVSTDGDNSNVVIGQMLQRRYGIGCVVVRIFDPRRADFYAERGLRTVCPTKTSIATLADIVRACDAAPVGSARLSVYAIVAGGGKVGANITRSLVQMGHEVTLIEQRRDRWEQLEVGARAHRPPGRRDRDPHPRARRHRPAAGDRARGDRRRRGQHRHLADRQGGLPRAEGDRARQRPAQPAVLRRPRHHADGLRDVRPARPRRARGARARPRQAARAPRRGPRARRAPRPAGRAGGRQAHRRDLASRRREARVRDAERGRRDRPGRHGDPARATRSSRS